MPSKSPKSTMSSKSSDAKGWSQEVPSETKPSKTYTVQSDGKGTISCTCPAWKHQKAPVRYRTCKHIKSILGEKAERKRIQAFKANPKKVAASSEKTRRTWTAFDRPMQFTRLGRPEEHVGWIASIKMNGAFARWDGSKMWSKSGRLLKPPLKIVLKLPKNLPLDGEIFVFKNIGAVRDATHYHNWGDGVQFVAFDTPIVGKTWVERYDRLKRAQKKYGFDMVRYRKIKDKKRAQEMMKKVVDGDHEGLVMRHPDSLYQTRGRSKDVVKWKPTFTTKVTVLEARPVKRGFSYKVQEVVTKGEKPVRKKGGSSGSGSKTFRIFEGGKAQKRQPGETYEITYTGRHENGTPELAQFST